MLQKTKRNAVWHAGQLFYSDKLSTSIALSSLSVTCKIIAPLNTTQYLILSVPSLIVVDSNLKLLTATDRDNGDNGRVTYSILQTVMDESKDVFALDSSSGMVKLKKPMDREKIAEHVLYIKAQDNGSPELRLSGEGSS